MKPKIWILFLLALFCFVPVASAQQVTVSEMEDRNFIKQLVKNDKLNFALEEAKSFQKNYPASVLLDEVRFYKGVIYSKKGRLDKAIEEFEWVVEHSPNSSFLEETYYNLSLLKIKAGDKTKGELYLTKLKQRFPFSKFLDQVHYPMGEVAFAKREWDKAILHFEKVYKNKKEGEKKRLLALYYLSWSRLKTGERAEALIGFKKLLKANLEQAFKAKISYQLGQEAIADGDYKRAKQWFFKQQSWYADPEWDLRSQFWFAESVYLDSRAKQRSFGAEEVKEAIKAYSKNLELDRPHQKDQSLLHRGLLHLELGDVAKAQADFERLQGEYPDYATDHQLHMMRADLYQKSGELAKANHHLDLALKHHQGMLDQEAVLFQRMENEFQLERCDQVLDLGGKLKKRVKLEERQRVHYYMGSCSYLKGDHFQASSHFRNVPLKSVHGEKIFLAGLESLQKLGRVKESAQWIEDGLRAEIKGDWSKVLRIKGQLHMKLMEWPRAVQAVELLLERYPSNQSNPWVLLELAKSHEKLAEERTNRLFSTDETIKSPKEHLKLALAAYEKVSNSLPESEIRHRLSILEHRRKLHQGLGEVDQVLALYQEALPLIDSPKKRDEMIFDIARTYLYEKKDQKEGMLWLGKIHRKAAREVNFEASILLGELFVSEKDLKSAARILGEVAEDLDEGTEHYFKIHYRRAELLMAQEDWQKALYHFRLVAKSRGDDEKKRLAQSKIKEIEVYLKSLKRKRG